MLIAVLSLIVIVAARFLPFDFAATLTPDWWQLLTAGLTDATIIGSIFSALWIFVLLYPAAKKLGPTTTCIVIVCGQLISATIGLGAAWVVSQAGGRWAEEFHHELYLTPWPWIFFTATFASAHFSALWRRRIRIGTLTLAATLLLFSGTLSDFPLIAGTTTGIIAGQLHAGRGFSRPRTSRREARILIATAQLATLAGPVITATIPGGSGIFHNSMLLTGADALSRNEAIRICAEQAGWAGNPHQPTSGCTHLLAGNAFSYTASMATNILPLIVVAVIALGLGRGRRLAWWLMLTSHLIALSILTTALADTNPTTALDITDALGAVLPSTLALILLLATKTLFTIPSTRTTRALAATAALTAATYTLWAASSFILRHHFTPTWTTADFGRVILPHAIGHTRTHLPHGAAAWAATATPTIIFWCGLAIIIYLALIDTPRPPHSQNQARRIFTSGTGDHLSAMTLWDGNHYWFHTPTPQHHQPDQTPALAYVAYRIHAGIAVTLGEPVIAHTDNPHDIDSIRHDAAQGFENYASEQGLTVAWYSVPDTFTRPGYKPVQVAQESIIPTSDTVAFTGKKFQDIRTARNRATKENITATWTTWDEAGSGMREKIIELSEQWVSDKALPEMGFTLGGINELKNARLLIAVDDTGHLHGITSWLETKNNGHTRGLVLDFMRRDAEGFRPVVEYLIAEAAISAHEEGLDFISLSGAPLAHEPTPGDTHQPSPLDNLLDYIGQTMEPLYGFRSLASFKKKFRPQHHNWVLLYEDELTLPAIGLAVVKCYLPTMDIHDIATTARELRAGHTS
ncbi:phosphatidylglycerol lysyltransferase domain-containing protein [Corynebacterium aquilae]|uniref:Phosphatidylglycerol lysyltransferase C-terminal domain-containing protein n=1 Tax=Corynebacterium aquilae DSM 44791 TaxID=1431546 RepID=A0A1L7CHX2_9CORY|nr:phosphatidylglycerol lysyltransferase domain-containing protein [Corynebacterium aquilae]APT85444.1 hypothetical protein CAQU_10720 [Corynebacterium aquilae DSM 44791]